MKKYSASCPSCYQSFQLSHPYQIYCSIECENEKKKILEDKREALLTRLCNQCGLSFRKTSESSKQTTCDLCRRNNVRKNSKRHKEKEKVKEKKPRRSVSLEELDRRAERKRVFDNKGWDHYLKGRKWDRI